jgi:hypothetical protein
MSMMFSLTYVWNVPDVQYVLIFVRKICRGEIFSAGTYYTRQVQMCLNVNTNIITGIFPFKKELPFDHLSTYCTFQLN